MGAQLGVPQVAQLLVEPIELEELGGLEEQAQAPMAQGGHDDPTLDVSSPDDPTQAEESSLRGEPPSPEAGVLWNTNPVVVGDHVDPSQEVGGPLDPSQEVGGPLDPSQEEGGLACPSRDGEAPYDPSVEVLSNPILHEEVGPTLQAEDPIPREVGVPNPQEVEVPNPADL